MGIKLHLGCGEKNIPGFIHVDVANFSHIDYMCEFKTLPFLSDGSVDLIYICHALTYYDRFEILDIFKEWLRILKPGGIARVSVTDFSAMLSIYNKTGDIKKVLGPIFGRWQVGDKHIYHKTIFDKSLLTEFFISAGFSLVREWDHTNVESSFLDDYSAAYYPHKDETGIRVSLNLEGVK